MKLLRAPRGDTLVEVMFAVGIFGAVAIGAISLMNKGVSTSQTTLETSMARQEIDAQSEALRFIHGAYVAESNTTRTNYSTLWTNITARAYSTSEILQEDSNFFTKVNAGSQSCSSLFSRPQRAFVLSPRNLGLNSGGNFAGGINNVLITGDRLQFATTYPRLLYGSSSGLSDTTVDYGTNTQHIASSSSLYAAEGIWVTAVASDAGSTTQPDFYDFYVQTCWNQAGTGKSATISSIIRLFNPDRLIYVP